MTQLAFILDGKDKARIFSDTEVKARDGKGKIWHEYKVRHLESIGTAMVSRGFVKTADYAVELANGRNIKDFDGLVAQLPAILKEAMRSTAIELFEMFPEHPKKEAIVTCVRQGEIDQVIKFIRTWKAESDSVGTFEQDLFAVGYSAQHKTMGLAVITSFHGFKLFEFYKKNRPFFMHNPEVEMHFKGRVPTTDKQMVKGMRFSHQIDVKTSPRPANLTREAKIKRTTVYADGHFLVRNLGPFLKK